MIVSPLLALMRNQIEAANRAGIHAVTVNSANTDDWSLVYGQVQSGEVDVLLVSPERLNNPEFRDQVLPELSPHRRDARRRRGALHLRLGARLPARLPAAAHAHLRAARRRARAGHHGHGERPRHHRRGRPARGLRRSGDGALVLRGELDRESLRLGVLPLPKGADRFAWLAQHLDDLPGSGIVYTLTVSAADELAAFLRERGHPVAAYTGKTDPAERERAEDDLLANRVKALVATSALGMGFDKPDLGFVVHLGAPQSPVAYYQQIGRAGRGVERAEVLLLPGPEDRDIWAYFASLGVPRRAAGPGRAVACSATPAARCPPPRSSRAWSSPAAGWR